MTNLNEITYVDWQYKLNGIGSIAEGVEDINQCIAVILSTQKGSVPHRPTFGSDILKYVDYPVNIAKDKRSAAAKMLKLFHTSFNKLSTYPEIGFSRPDFTYKDVKFFVVKKHYLIVYKTTENELHILRVLSAYQDICAML